jgi:hypothetical protein
MKDLATVISALSLHYEDAAPTAFYLPSRTIELINHLDQTSVRRGSMESFSVKPITGLSVLGLLLGLGICDVWLLIHVQKQNAMIVSFSAPQLPPLPSLGEKVSSIVGFALKDGQPLQLTPENTTPRFALLVFREGCPFCEANWRNWDSTFGPEGSNVDVVLVTTDKALSQSYKDAHPLLQKKQVVLGVSPYTLKSLKLAATPETVYVVDGKVKRDWVGVLSERNIKEIITATSHS